MDMSFSSRGASKPWLNACKYLCWLQIVGGLALAVCSSAYLFSFAMMTGQLIGGLLVIVGCIGMYGSMKSNREALNLHLLGVLLAMMMAFNFLGQVIREMDVDCALAEMYVRGLATEDLIKKQHESEIFNSLYTRMNEMEDMMHSVESGAFARLQHKKEQENLKSVDSDYVMAKMMMLHDHAEELVKKIVNHEDVTDPDKHQQWTKEDQDEVVKIFDVCEKIITKMRGVDKDGNDTGKDHIEIHYGEYEGMLKELADVFGESKAGGVTFQGDTTHLHKAMEELPNMQAAMDRMERNEYDHLRFGATGAEVEALDQQAVLHTERRQKWISEFTNQLAKHKQSNVMDMDLSSLPEHCLVETKGRWIMTLAGFTTLMSQVASGYCVLSTLFKIPVKVD